VVTIVTTVRQVGEDEFELVSQTFFGEHGPHPGAGKRFRAVLRGAGSSADVASVEGPRRRARLLVAAVLPLDVGSTVGDRPVGTHDGSGASAGARSMPERSVRSDRGSEAIGMIIWNLEALARRVTLVPVWRSFGSHALSGGLRPLPASCEGLVFRMKAG
jgi:hypothetical protein